MVLRPQTALRDQPQRPDYGAEDHPRQHRRQHRAGRDDPPSCGQALRRQGLHRPRTVPQTLAAWPTPHHQHPTQHEELSDALADKVMLRKRFVIETVLDTLKSEMGLEHSRHRSVINAMVHVLSCLVAYAFRPGKPSISLKAQEITAYP